MNNNFNIFFEKKPPLMLIALKNNVRARYGFNIAKEIDCTYSHASKILQCFEKMRLVDFERKGRIKLIKLTRTGLEVANHIERIKELLE